jgi:tetratricopeptide (TPR) repeat protein
MDDVFLIQSPDDIVLYLQSSIAQGVLANDERVARIVELSRLAYDVKEQGDLQTALQYESEAYRLCLQLIDASGGFSFPSLVAAKLYNMGQLHYRAGEFEEAKLCFEQAKGLDADAGNLVGEAASVRSLGFLCHELGDLSGALRLHREALKLDRKADFEYGVAIDRANIGAIYCDLGDFGPALPYLKLALSSFEALDHVQEVEKVKQLIRTAKSMSA